MLHIAGVVILYYPDAQVLTRIETYLNRLDILYIIDNSEKKTAYISSLLRHHKVVYLHDNENKGISIRLNQAANLALQKGYNWLLTMDQDSYFSTNSVSQYFDCIENNEDKAHTAMFGVQFLNESPESNTCSSIEVLRLITSGSMLNLNLFTLIGAFDEALFIDKVDDEYCLRAHLNHYKIIQFRNIHLHHHLGTITYRRSLKSLNKTPRVLHHPLRIYYMVRNYFYLRSKYNNLFKEYFKETKQELLNRIKNNFLYGKSKLQLLKYLYKGYADYLTGKMGKIN